MSAATRRPYLGEGIHYMAHGSLDGIYLPECRAAFITKADGANSGVAVINPTGFFFHPELTQDEDRSPGTWHYAH